MLNKFLKIGIIPIIFFGIILLFSENFLEDNVFADQIITFGTATVLPEFPRIISFTAAGDVEVPVVFGNGDTLTITFDRQTSRPTAGTKSEIDNVFEFRQGGVPISIGDDYVGSWLSTSVFQVRIVNSANNDGPLVGQLTVKVKLSGNLLDITETSNPSFSEFSFLGGNFGELRGPVATSLAAEDLPPIVAGYSAEPAASVIVSRLPKPKAPDASEHVGSIVAVAVASVAPTVTPAIACWFRKYPPTEKTAINITIVLYVFFISYAPL